MLMLLADVVVGVKTTFDRCLLPSGRWNSYYRVVCLILFLLLEADGRAMGLLYMKLNLKKFR